LEDILHQCISQETNPLQFQFLLDRGGVISPFSGNYIPLDSYYDRIVEWASHTQLFHSILIIVENPESIAHRSLDAFIGACTSLRSISCIPLNLLFLVTSDTFAKSSLSNVHSHSIDGASLRQFQSPNSKLVFDHLLQLLYGHIEGKYNLPVLLTGSILSSIRERFELHHGSVVTAVRDIKMAMSHHFARRGSFLALMHNASFVRRHGKRLAWFCLDRQARSFMLSMIHNNNTNDNEYNNNQNANHSDIEIKGLSDSRSLFTAIQATVEERSFPSLVGRLVHIASQYQNSLCSPTNSTLATKLDHETNHNSHALSLSKPTTNDWGVTNTIEHCLTLSETYKNNARNIFEFLRKAPLHDIASLLFQWREEASNTIQACQSVAGTASMLCEYLDIFSWDHEYSRNPNEKTAKLIDFINECLILVGSIHDELEKTTTDEEIVAHDDDDEIENSHDSQGQMVMRSSGVIEKELRQFLVMGFETLFRKTSLDFNRILLSTFSVFKDSISSNFGNSRATLFEESIRAEPRRLVAEAIRQSLSTSHLASGKNDDNYLHDPHFNHLSKEHLTRDVGIIFQAMDSRVISTIDWFESFTHNIITTSKSHEASNLSQKTIDTLFKRFVFGVYQLMLCGFVARSKRRDDSFEKIAMVWCTH